MKLASLRRGGRDGSLIIVNKSLTHYQPATDIAPTMQYAIEHWQQCQPALQKAYKTLCQNEEQGPALSFSELTSPLPRAYQWLDGSAYLSHVERVRKARGAEMPPSFLNDPLMYQGGSDYFLPPHSPLYAGDEAWGIDFESEVTIVTDDVPQGATVEQAGQHIKLIMLVNDVSLRNLIPAELAKGFGFIHGKPPSAFSPIAITPDELGDNWHNAKVHLPLYTYLNGQLFGEPNAGEDMQFSFAQLIQHAAKTRPLGAGTIIGSGTVSNNDISTGCSCLAEKRVLEIIEQGEAKTPFLHFSDTIKIEMLDEHGQSIFGSIEQTVTPYETS